jgi:hypothetical protein
MPRFHLHIHDRGGVSFDEEGLELADLRAARAYAVDGIRSLAGEEVRFGQLSLDIRVEIADEAGRILETVRFADAIEVRLPEEAR